MTERSNRRPVPSGAGRRLTDTERDLIRLAQSPDFPRRLAQIHSTGGCAHPVYLSGHTTTTDTTTGAVLRSYDTTTEPGGRLAIRCGNRRESRCLPCSRLHSGDTFHLVRSGLLGGKGVPGDVAGHPRLFVTLTAPSFGAVHRVTSSGIPCHARREAGDCEHGHPLDCFLDHDPGDPAVGQPLCLSCYDYPGHVLWHAAAGALWNRTTQTIRRRLASAVDVPQSRITDHLRLGFAKVTEYQRRGAVHFHAVIRLDGPTGPDAPPPSWAPAEFLADAVREAAASTRVSLPYAAALGEHTARWGAQLDVHPIHSGQGSDALVSDQGVAAYVAKYVAKSVGDAGGWDRPITSYDEITSLPVSAHIRTLMTACWRLGALPELSELRLRAWVHTLGYRGHVLTKSLRYSTTYSALRAAREEHRHPDQDDTETVTDASWRYVGSGLTPGGAEIAAGVAEDLAELRRFDAPCPSGVLRMTRDLLVGQFHFNPLAVFPDGTPRWWLTVVADPLAREVARLLGGVPKPMGDGLEMVTDRTAIGVVVRDTTDRELRFCLADAPHLGLFAVPFPTWTLPEVMGPLPPCTGRPAVMSLHAIDFTTLSGTLVRYGQPVISLPP